MKPLSLYFHWPFCVSKCPYCDFNVHIAQQLDHARWQTAFLRAIDHYADLYPNRALKTIYFGGGTPSLMPPEMIEAIINRAADRWALAPSAEITLEANPVTAEINKFKAFRNAGINRLSLGVQALDSADLKFLGRAHDLDGALKAIDAARIVFDRFTFDLIYARPNQTLQMWEGELTQAAQLAAGHLSLYQLTIERSTPFYLRHARGEFALPDQDLAADFYELTQGILEAKGLPAYETSNHARKGHESQHNLTYWHYRDYIGIGPGAHGRMTTDNGAHYALRDHQAPEKWLDWVDQRGCGAHEAQLLSPWDRAAEALMMGLRLYEGINIAPYTDFIDFSALDKLASDGALCYDSEVLRVTRSGMLRLNALLPYIIKDQE